MTKEIYWQPLTLKNRSRNDVSYDPLGQRVARICRARTQRSLKGFFTHSPSSFIDLCLPSCFIPHSASRISPHCHCQTKKRLDRIDCTVCSCIHSTSISSFHDCQYGILQIERSLGDSGIPPPPPSHTLRFRSPDPDSLPAPRKRYTSPERFCRPSSYRRSSEEAKQRRIPRSQQSL